MADGVGGGNLVVAGVKTVRGPQSHPVESHFMKAILERRAVVNGGIEEGFHGEFNNIHVDAKSMESSFISHRLPTCCSPGDLSEAAM